MYMYYSPLSTQLDYVHVLFTSINTTRLWSPLSTQLVYVHVLVTFINTTSELHDEDKALIFRYPLFT